MSADRNTLDLRAELLTVRPRGLDKLWCFRREIRVPTAEISSVRVAPKSAIPRGLRTLGTDLGVKICGTFQSRGASNFWNYRGPGPVLVIELAPTQPFRHLYLSVAAPERVAEMLSARLGLH